MLKITKYKQTGPKPTFVWKNKEKQKKEKNLKSCQVFGNYFSLHFG